jgi:hypothetical protein
VIDVEANQDRDLVASLKWGSQGANLLEAGEFSAFLTLNSVSRKGDLHKNNLSSNVKKCLFPHHKINDKEEKRLLDI